MAGPRNWGVTGEHRDRYDLVTARAVAPLNVLAEYLLPLVRPGGLAVIYKGPGAPQEFMEARQAIKLLAGDAVRLAPVEVPFLQREALCPAGQEAAPDPTRSTRAGRDWRARSPCKRCSAVRATRCVRYSSMQPLSR